MLTLSSSFKLQGSFWLLATKLGLKSTTVGYILRIQRVSRVHFLLFSLPPQSWPNESLYETSLHMTLFLCLSTLGPLAKQVFTVRPVNLPTGRATRNPRCEAAIAVHRGVPPAPPACARSRLHCAHSMNRVNGIDTMGASGECDRLDLDVYAYWESCHLDACSSRFRIRQYLTN